MALPREYIWILTLLTPKYSDLIISETIKLGYSVALSGERKELFTSSNIAHILSLKVSSDNNISHSEMEKQLHNIINENNIVCYSSVLICPGYTVFWKPFNTTLPPAPKKNTFKVIDMTKYSKNKEDQVIDDKSKEKESDEPAG